MRTSIWTALVFVAILGVRSAAEADEFQAVAAGCVPTDTNINSPNYLVTAGTVKHRSTQTSKIVLSCPISQTISRPTHLYLMYKDNSSASSSTYVKVQLVRHDWNLSDGYSSICTLSSNSSTQDSAFHLLDVSLSNLGCSITTTDWDQNYHGWSLIVSLERATTNHTVIFYGAGVY